MPRTETSEYLLERLVGFPTVSRDSNLDLIEFAVDHLRSHGIEAQLVHDETGRKANLYAVIGPDDVPGVMLSGHSDVVPVDGQDWSSDPFLLSRREDRLYGRGSADMKGFIACVLALVPDAAKRRLARPLHLAFSYDEEVGCLGVRRLIDMLETAPLRPALCIIGEPTSMQVVVAHKGKTAARVTCSGRSCHSSLPKQGLNAIHLAVDMVSEIRAMQAEIEASGVQDRDYDAPHTTLHIGTINGGTALNIVPNECVLDFEIRNLPADDPAPLLARLEARAAELTEAARRRAPEAGVRLEVRNAYPALDTAPDEEVVTFVKSLLGANSHGKITFGTEGGLFRNRLGVPTVVCGPGSIAQAHQPDEYIERAQLARCDAFLRALLDRLAA